MTILHDFAYERPSTLDDALALLDAHRERLRPLAGGTDLVVNMKLRGILQLTSDAGTPHARWPAARTVQPVQQPDVVMSLADLASLRGLELRGDAFRIGPTTTMAEIAAAAGLPPTLGALRDAAAIMGSPLIRNRATVGGNVVNARPAADTAVALLALGARLELASRCERRRVDLSSFFTGPGRCVRRDDELLVGIDVPCGAAEGSAYLRMGQRRQLEIALTCAAAWLRLDPLSGTIAAARIALGAVGPTPVLATAASRELVGRRPTPEAFAAAARAARAEARPIDDFRGSAAYRLELVEVLVGRALAEAASRTAVRGAAQ
jgi:carbon-monoxide dehydrogenase medium subunit